MTDSRVIVALDVPAPRALEIAGSLKGFVGWVKIGMTLFYAEGPSIVARMRDLGFEVFLDLKLHDIPHQVAGAAAVVSRLGIGMLTVHAAGGAPMMQAAKEASAIAAAEEGLPSPKVLAVTVLTSIDGPGLTSIGVESDPVAQVDRLGSLARSAGVDGVVCSPQEAARMRTLFGAEGLVVTPGVRPTGSASGDQARIATPAAALSNGASHLVIGRPVTAASDPAAAVKAILQEIGV